MLFFPTTTCQKICRLINFKWPSLFSDVDKAGDHINYICKWVVRGYISLGANSYLLRSHLFPAFRKPNLAAQNKLSRKDFHLTGFPPNIPISLKKKSSKMLVAWYSEGQDTENVLRGKMHWEAICIERQIDESNGQQESKSQEIVQRGKRI